ncbi:OLC1v1014838C1 [Oldenlandia corymbosa var. corymbosa]|uniref:OLC1v1014838C1 n=1 Tax=Oldenlandia corymbosa var. corymbosa TaxID=529605 RepID=A0AAV1E5I9_OLDCO|nr:OLC1v1014838C1 [Oldenlandia corymbosa var. corymbosa]
MASNLSLPPAFIQNPNMKRSYSQTLCQSNLLSVGEHQKEHGPAKPDTFLGLRFFSWGSRTKAAATKWMAPGALSSTDWTLQSDKICCEDESSAAITRVHEMEFNRVNCLVQLLHESARGFSLDVQAHDLVIAEPELAMAWRGVDVHAWHRNIAYQVSVYALLKAAIEVETFLSHKRSNNPSLVQEILSLKAHLLYAQIERELKTKNSKLVQWFKLVELPRISEQFIPLFKKWSMEYAGSGVAGTILALSCFAAIKKLDSQRISRPMLFISIEDALVNLISSTEGLVSVNKLHQFACEAGFEQDFLLHFGRRILPSKSVEDLEFWIGLVERKLSTAFQRESLITVNDEVKENSLTTLGLFAYLGRETRIYLSRMGIKDLNEHCQNFLSYLECGSMLIHPNLSTMSEYHLFMEVVTDEIGWLHFYPLVSLEWCQHKRKSKRQMTQAEQEIILYRVLTACYDVISGFAHYSNSTQQPMNSYLLEFLLNSQSLLSTCMDYYWAAFDNLSEPQKLLERGMFNSILESPAEGTPKIWSQSGTHFGSRVNQATGTSSEDVVTLRELDSSSAEKLREENFLKKSSRKAISTSVNAWMGTQLLFVDMIEVVELLKKQIRGCKMTKREKKKIKRTLADFATLVPILILMLLPVSAVGHAAMLAAIKKYLPCLIPSPYTSERLGMVKQLKRIKKLELPKRGKSNIEDYASKFYTNLANPHISPEVHRRRAIIAPAAGAGFRHPHLPSKARRENEWELTLASVLANPSVLPPL